MVYVGHSHLGLQQQQQLSGSFDQNISSTTLLQDDSNKDFDLLVSASSASVKSDKLMSRRKAIPAKLDIAIGEVTPKLTKVAMMVMTENCMFYIESEVWMVSNPVERVTEDNGGMIAVRNQKEGEQALWILDIGLEKWRTFPKLFVGISSLIYIALLASYALDVRFSEKPYKD